MFKSISTDPRVDRVLLGLGLAFLAVFSVAVVWLYFGQGNAITDGVVVLFGIFSLIALVERGRGKIRLGFGLRGGAARAARRFRHLLARDGGNLLLRVGIGGD